MELLCRCERLVEEQPELFVAFVQALGVQTEHVPDDFFEDIVASSNFLIASAKVECSFVN